MELPSGDYAIKYDAASGSSVIYLPDSGQIDMTLDGASGAIKLVLPRSMQANIDVDSGSGAWRVQDNRFTTISGDDKDGIWQTADYTESADNQLNLNLDIGSGSVTLSND